MKEIKKNHSPRKVKKFFDIFFKREALSITMTLMEKLNFPLICVFVTIVTINAAVVKVTMGNEK